MAKFSYKMQNILDVKYKLETQAKTAFSMAASRLNQEEEKLEGLHQRRRAYESHAKELVADKLDFREIKVNRIAIETVKGAIQNQVVAVHVAQRNLENARIRLKDVMTERKTHEILKEKAFDEFKKELEKEESKVVDSMAEDVLDQLDGESGALDKKARKKAEKARKKEEKKQRKEEKKQQGEEAAEEEDGGGSKIAVVLATIVFIAIWLAILGLIIKMDIGGFGSTVLQPILKDVPVVNKILPESAEGPVVDAQYPYTTLNEAIERIKELEVELSNAQTQTEGNSDYVAQLEAEVARLREFESEQSAFEEEKTKFYKEVVFNENAPDISEYKAYYEGIDPANAEVLYKQVVQQQQASEEIEEYAKTYSEMKPNQAAAIMEAMQDNLKLVVKILQNMETDARSKILAAMDAEVAARITKMMEP